MPRPPDPPHARTPRPAADPVDALRGLTAAERSYLQRTLTRRRVVGVMLAVVLVVVAAVPLAGYATAPVRGGDEFWAGVVLAAVGVGCGAAVAYFVAFRRQPWQLPAGRYARVGRLRGTYYTAGKPLLQYVGEYPVHAADQFALGRGEVVEVEVCPSVEEVPSKRQARVVLSVAGRPTSVDALVREGRWPSSAYGA